MAKKYIKEILNLHGYASSFVRKLTIEVPNEISDQQGHHGKASRTHLLMLDWPFNEGELHLNNVLDKHLAFCPCSNLSSSILQNTPSTPLLSRTFNNVDLT